MLFKFNLPARPSKNWPAFQAERVPDSSFNFSIPSDDQNRVNFYFSLVRRAGRSESEGSAERVFKILFG